MVKDCVKTVRLSDFVENPDNPSVVSDEAFERLLGKVKRLPDGLKADRIAYVTDNPAGKCVVLSGHKRLRCLKQIHGEDAEVPADWFQDITAMDDDARREFIVDANINEGQWVSSMLLSMHTADELKELMDGSALKSLLADIPSEQQIAENQELEADAFEDVMVLKVKIPADARDKAEAVLDGIDADNHGAALMKIVRGAA